MWTAISLVLNGMVDSEEEAYIDQVMYSNVIQSAYNHDQILHAGQQFAGVLEGETSNLLAG